MSTNPLEIKLEPGQWAVVLAEAKTGIILTPTGERHHLGQGPFFSVFASESDALAFAHDYVKRHPAIECVVQDHGENHVRRITVNSTHSYKIKVE